MLKSRSFIAAIAAGTLFLAGCSHDATDYAKTAESTITKALGKGSTATCQKPDSTDVGTTFTCTGTDPTGVVAQYLTTINKKDSILVTPADAAGPADSTADSTVDTSTGDSTVETTGDSVADTTAS